MRVLVAMQVTSTRVWALDEDGLLWVASLPADVPEGIYSGTEDDGGVGRWRSWPGGPIELEWHAIRPPPDANPFADRRDKFDKLEEKVRATDRQRKATRGAAASGDESAAAGGDAGSVAGDGEPLRDWVLDPQRTSAGVGQRSAERIDDRGSRDDDAEAPATRD